MPRYGLLGIICIKTRNALHLHEQAGVWLYSHCGQGLIVGGAISQARGGAYLILLPS